jgi:hypothetical protein
VSWRGEWGQGADVATETDNLSPAVWNEIYRAIERGGASREVYQGVVTDRDSSRGYVWVRELSSDPIEVTGHSTEVGVMIGGVLKPSRVPPATPEIGDVVTLVRTASDQFKCVGVQQTTRKWQADPRFGLIPPDSITANEIAPDAIGTSELAPLAVTNAEVAVAAAILGSKLNLSIGSSPPGSPTSGDFWIYPGSGFYWVFVYDNSETTLKWKYIGGPPLLSEIATSETTASTTYVDLATAGPSVTLPRAGDYIVSHGNSCFCAVGSKQFQTVKIGAAAATDAKACIHDAVNLTDTPAKTFRVSGAAASDVLKLMYRNNVTNTGTWLERWISVVPVRVI